MAEMVSGMQLLVDAALAHRTLDDILADLVTRVRGVLGADAATIYLAEEDERLVPRGRLGRRARRRSREPIAFGEGFAGRVAQAREAMLAARPAAGRAARPGAARARRGLADRRAAAGRGRGDRRARGRAAARRGASRAEDLSAAAAGRRPRGARDRSRARLRARAPDRRDAPAQPAARTACRSSRASTSRRATCPRRPEAEVGGDWYDVIPIPGGGVGLVMGDVAGKGLAAASMVGRLRSALRAYALEGHDARARGRAAQPAGLDRGARRARWRRCSTWSSTRPRARVRWVNAGPPAAARDRGRRLAALPARARRSVPLGVLPFPSYRGGRPRTLEPGSTLVLYTDGLIERPGEHIDDGHGRARGARARARPRTRRSCCDHLLDDARARGRRHRRRRAPDAAQPPDAGPLQRRVRRRARVAGADARAAAPLARATPARTDERSPRSRPPAARRRRTPSSTPAGRRQPLRGERAASTARRSRSPSATTAPGGQPREGDQGRGLSLMRALMDTVEVTPTPEGTTVRLPADARTAAEGPSERWTDLALEIEERGDDRGRPRDGRARHRRRAVTPAGRSARRCRRSARGLVVDMSRARVHRLERRGDAVRPGAAAGQPPPGAARRGADGQAGRPRARDRRVRARGAGSPRRGLGASRRSLGRAASRPRSR